MNDDFSLKSLKYFKEKQKFTHHTPSHEMNERALNPFAFIVQPNCNRNSIHEIECFFSEMLLNVIMNNLFEWCSKKWAKVVWLVWRRIDLMFTHKHFTSMLHQSYGQKKNGTFVQTSIFRINKHLYFLFKINFIRV